MPSFTPVLCMRLSVRNQLYKRSVSASVTPWRDMEYEIFSAKKNPDCFVCLQGGKCDKRQIVGEELRLMWNSTFQGFHRN